MKRIDPIASTCNEPQRNVARLKSDQISPLGLAALAIGILSPALGLFALWGPMQAAAGPISPLVFLGAAALAMPTAISYAVLNREAPSAGAASTWLWRAVSPPVGYLIGLTMTAYFMLATLAQPLLFALFFRDLLSFCGLPDYGVPTLIGAILVISLPVMFAAYRGAEASTRVAVTLMIIESAIVLALSGTILYVKSSVPGGINWSPFNPFAASHGLHGYWTALLLGILAYCGFDVVSTAAEETSAPREFLPKAILLTILGITAFWVLNAWAFTLAIPHVKVVEYSSQGLTAVTPMAHEFWGRGNLLVILASFTGLFAVYITGALGTSRIIFALARHGLLPPVLSELDRQRRVPINAMHTVFGLVIVGDVTSILILHDGLAAFTWWANAMVFFATVTFAAVNIANVCYFRRVARERFRLWTNLVIPILGAVSTFYVMYETFFVALWSADFRSGRSVVIFSVLVFVLFVLVVGTLGLRSPGRLQGDAPIEADWK
jgi:basic amino acid/polyamine antiporter, APA family